MQQYGENYLTAPKIYFHFEFSKIQVEIETERLYIISYRDEDFENCLSLYSDEILTKHFDHGKPRSKTEIEKYLYERGKKFSNEGYPLGLFSIFNKQDMSFLGQVDLVPVEQQETVEIGCILHRKFHNQGFPLEACKVLTYSLVQELNQRDFKYNGDPITRVIATAHPKNYASQRLIKNLGMIFYKSEERFGNPRLWYHCLPCMNKNK